MNSRPNKIAVSSGDEKITFKKLDKESQFLANIIFNKTKSNNKVIGVFLPKSIEVILSNIAITFSGNAYMNIDVLLPIERLRSIFDVINPVLIISNSENIQLIKEIDPSLEILNIDLKSNFSPENHLEKINSKIIDTDPYCIINTSGSTGTPKGVVLNHRSFRDFGDWATESFNFSESDIIGSLSPVVFDIYSFELWLLMTKGASIILIPHSLSSFPIKILELLKQTNVSFIFWVPTIMATISNLDLLSKITLNKLRLVWFAGEVFPTIHFNYWRKNLSITEFVNLYGPIEITLDCIFYKVNRDFKDNEPLPIGTPCKNTDVLILNNDLKPVRIGEEGELYVRGTSLAMGYYNNRNKTNAAFIQNPLNSSYPELIYKTGDIVYQNSNSEIIFVGRKDTLIKHLGYRIELGEIEHILINKLKLVKNGCVIYDKDKKQIIVIYEAQDKIPDLIFIESFKNYLPKYMLPSKFIKIKELPTNVNGKIDRLFVKKKINMN